MGALKALASLNVHVVWIIFYLMAPSFAEVKKTKAANKQTKLTECSIKSF